MESGRDGADASGIVVTATDSAGLERVFRVRISARDMLARLDRRIEQARGGLRLKGFRPGKVPASHIRRIYGRSMMEEEVRSAVGESARSVIEDHSLRLATGPDVHMVSDGSEVVSGASDLEFDLKMEVLPEVTVAPLSELRLVRYTADIPPDEVTRALSSLADSAATTHPSSDGYRAQRGDVCVVSYRGLIDGEPFAGSEATDDVVLIGGGRHLSDLEDALVGSSAGDEGRVGIVFPQDYGAVDIRGKRAEFSYRVREVRLRRVPVVDDSLAVSFGLQTVSELEAAVLKRLQAGRDSQARRVMEQAALDWLDDRHGGIELPVKLVEHEYERLREVVSGRQRVEAADESERGLRDRARRRVRLGLVLARIGSDAGIEVRQSELDRAIEAELSRHGSVSGKTAEYLRKNPEAIDRIRAPIYEGKVINYVIERAEVTTMALSFGEFQSRVGVKGEVGI